MDRFLLRLHDILYWSWIWRHRILYDGWTLLRIRLVVVVHECNGIVHHLGGGQEINGLESDSEEGNPYGGFG